jgi:aldehyde dehydrogenase (NAD+)
MATVAGEAGAGEGRLFIDGRLTEARSGRRYANINPADESVVGEVADAGPEDMEAAIAAARRAFDETDWSTNVELRLKCLTQLRDGLRAVMPELREQIVREVGAPMAITHNGPQGDGPVGILDYYLDVLKDYNWQQELPVTRNMGVPSRRFVLREAAGVVAAVTPWNFPFQINMAKLAPALAAGCTTVLKPAPDTPWSATILGRVAAEYTDIPAGVLNVVTASNPAAIGEMLVTDPRVDVVSFTGSTQTGRHIMAQAAATIKKVFSTMPISRPHCRAVSPYVSTRAKAAHCRPACCCRASGMPKAWRSCRRCLAISPTATPTAKTRSWDR